MPRGRPDTSPRASTAGTQASSSGRTRVVLEGLKVHMADLYEGLREIDLAMSSGDSQAVIRIFTGFRKVSVDYGLMEKADNVLMLKADFAWDDVGTWGSLRRVMELDKDGNYASGRTICVDTKDSVVCAQDVAIGAVGVANLIIVATPEGVLVCDGRRDQETRQIARMFDEEEIKARSAQRGEGVAMVSKVFTSSLYGIDGIRVEVEVDISHGLPSFNVVGLPEPSVKESRERVRAAIKNAGFEFPNDRITVNLAPADVRKEGSSFDLPVAIGMLAAMGVVKQDTLKDHLITGELSLDGRIKGVRGVLPMTLLAQKEGFTHIIVPHDNGLEASVVKDIQVRGAAHLLDIVHYLKGDSELGSLSPRRTVGRTH